VLCVLLIACLTAACGSLELRPDDATAAEWKSTAQRSLGADLRYHFDWTGGGIRLECGGPANFDPSEFSVIWHVRNESSEPLTIRILHTVPDGSAVVGEREWMGRSQFLSSIVDGESFTLPNYDSTGDLWRLRADRAWTPDDPMRDGDTVSYDVEITSASGTTTCRLRMVIARRWSDTFDEWWQPIVWVPLLPICAVGYGVVWIAMGGQMID
jgi:hypothetical protein